MNKKYDYIIIGQGLAGSAFAWKLYFNGKSFIIIDSEAKFSASKAKTISNKLILTKRRDVNIILTTINALNLLRKNLKID